MFPSIGRDNRQLMLSLVLWALGEGLWFNLRPIFIEQLGATPGQVGLVLAMGGVARVAFLIPGGWLSDRYGPRNLMLAAWLTGIVAALLVGLAPDWRWIIPGEFAYGASVFVIPALNSYALQAMPHPEEEQSIERTLTTIYAAYAAGLIVSQSLGGVIADRYGIRATYWVALVLFVISTFVMFRIRRYPVPRQGTKGGWRVLARNRALVALVVFFFLAMLGMTLGWPLAPIFLHDVRGFSLGWIGVFASLLSVGTVVWNLTLGRVRPRLGLVATLALVWLSMLILLQSGAALAVGLAYLMLGAFLTARSLMNAAVARRVPPAQRGVAFGIAELSLSLAMALSPRIAGALYEVGPHLPFVASLVTIPFAAILGVVLLSVVRREAVTPVPRLAHSPAPSPSVPSAERGP